MGEQKKDTGLYKIRMKHERSGRTDVEALREDTEKFLAEKKPTTGELDILAGVWSFVAENIEREEWKYYTREEWEELERYYVEHTHYTKPDLFDDVLTKYERGLMTAEEAQAYTKQYRQCKYRFCENVFKPKRKNQHYCTKYSCRQKEWKAQQNFNKTGTYLPPSFYDENRDDTNERNYMEREIAFNLAEAGNGENEENAENTAARLQQKWYGGKRDRIQEAQEWIKEEEISAEILQKTAEIRHYNPVIYSKKTG